MLPPPSPQLLRLYRSARWRDFREEAMLHPVGQALHLLFCLVSPLGALGLYLPGLLLTALFAAALSGLMLWSRSDIAGTVLLWWLGWGILVWAGLFLLRLLAAWQRWRERRRYHSSVDGEGGACPTPCFSPCWRRTEEGWEAEVSLFTPARGLCVLELTTEDEAGELVRDSAGFSACWEEGVAGLRKRYLLFLLLEAGLHHLPLALAGGSPGGDAPEASLRLVHPAGGGGAGFCHLP